MVAGSSAREPVRIRDQRLTIRPIGLAAGPRAVSLVMWTVAEEPAGWRQDQELRAHEPRLAQRTGLAAIGSGDERPLQDVAEPPYMVLAIPGQSEGRFRGLYLELAR